MSDAAAPNAGPPARPRARDAAAPGLQPKYPGVGKLKGKVALITGGDSGIGRAVAVAMAREGAEIAIVYLDEHKDANETARAWSKQEGADALLLAGDVGDENFCRGGGRGDDRGVRPPRHPGQQRRRAARDRGHPRHRGGADRAHLPHQYVQLLLHDQARAAPHEEGREHHQHRRRSPPIRATRRCSIIPPPRAPSSPSRARCRRR